MPYFSLSRVFSGRLGSRIVLLFIVCALVPIAAIAGFSFVHMDSQIEHQVTRWLHQEARTRGLGLFERISLLERELRLCAHFVSKHPGAMGRDAFQEFEGLDKGFHGVIHEKGASVHRIHGETHVPRPLNGEESAQMAGGKSVVILVGGEGDRRIFLARFLDPVAPEEGIIWGEINALFLMGLTDSAGYVEKTIIGLFDREGGLVHASNDLPAPVLTEIGRRLRSGTAGEFRLTLNDEPYRACYWSVFLRAEFVYPYLGILLCAPEEDVFAAPNAVKNVFPRVLAVTLLSVIFLSLVQIRRNLKPLQVLTEGTRRIAQRHFDTRVQIPRRDEFGELAVSFNDMALHLEGQFKTLTAISEIGMAVFSLCRRDETVETILTRVRDILGFELVGLIMKDRHGDGTRMMLACKDQPRLVTTEKMELPLAGGLFQQATVEVFTLTAEDGSLPPFLGKHADGRIRKFLILPASTSRTFSNYLVLGLGERLSEAPDINLHARSIADQVGLALSNADLVEDLKDMSWETLRALARAVDAKSPWTAGHSERVTWYAMEIAREMGLDHKALDELHRAALLHDIGKIGIPGALLDKPGRLTEEEYEVVKRHPELGGKIIEPIRAYAPVLNMVVQHHERFDGKGYPQGLSGKEICFGARILAVADAFDAMSSDRPYRVGMVWEKCIEIVRSERTKAFDPEVVDALLRIAAREGERFLTRAVTGTEGMSAGNFRTEAL